MSFLVNAYKSASKSIKHYLNPNENPTDNDKYAFKLLDNLSVEEFVEFCQERKVNPNVTIMNGLSLLIKAVEIAHKQKEGLTAEDVLSRCIIAINFLLKQGADINHQDKSGRTALLTACHWQQIEIVRLLIKHKADLNLATTQQGWRTNPLVAACFKKNYPIIELLVVSGCNIELAEQLNQQQNGFRLQLPEIAFIQKAVNIRKLLLIKLIQEKSRCPESKKFLANLSTIHFDRIIEIC